MKIVEGSQNPTQWSHPSHPGVVSCDPLWSLVVFSRSLAVLCGPLLSLAVFIVTRTGEAT